MSVVHISSIFSTDVKLAALVMMICCLLC